MAAINDLGAYKDALLVLGTAGVVVPLMHRWRVSPVLGFLLAGALLSPHGLGALSSVIPAIDWITVTSPDRVATLAELGVVFLLFLIGLELSFERLLTMRRMVFGLGTLQVLICGAIVGVLALALGEPPIAALVIGAALSLSSTAIVIEVLAGQKRLASATGRTSFSILLFQDLAVVPILFLIGVLDPQAQSSVGGGIVKALAQAAAALVLIVTVGRYLLQPLFRVVAQTGSQDMFIATTLFVAVGTSFSTALAGLSMPLGAFVAGLLLAETEYRRAIEAIIEPIKSLLLGVFFFSVGLSLDIGVVLANPGTIAAFALPHLVLQAGVIYALARMFGVAHAPALETAALLAPGGEFAFVVLTLAVSSGLVNGETTKILLASVALSMALIPALGKLARLATARFAKPAIVDPELAALPELEKAASALVVGYGRVGELICGMLETHGVSYIAVDREPRLVGSARREGKPVYFGDVRQIEFLNRCGLDTAKAAIITIHTRSEIDQIVTTLRQAYPKLLIVARAKDATHASHLYALGVNDAVPETIEASLQLSEAALVGLGVPTGLVIASVHQKRDDFRAELQGAAKKAGTQTRAFPKRKS
ncbi:MAG: cation:proton antiporter [Hyphomicrobium sp.]|nr:cation:proton antiporter [Hyphomicrobium sp.]